MIQRLRFAVLAMALVAMSFPVAAQNPTAAPEISPEKMMKLFAKASSGKEDSLQDFDKVTKDAKKHEGLFNLYEKDDHLYAEIKPNQFDQMLLAPMAIARGAASAGTPLNFGDEWVLTFKKINDKEVQLIRKNIRYEAPKDSPLARAVEQNYTDSVLMTLPIISKTPNNGFLIDLSDIFLTNFAQVPFGSLDRSRTRWHKIKTFEKNIELEVEATFSGGRYGAYGSYGDDGVIDSRGITLVLHYSLVKRPDSGYKARLADARVGHFINATKDFASTDSMTTFVRRVNRWNLEKANPSADLSAPKKQLVWWVENTVPHEYRPYVEAGILEWNKAFEKIGFRNAIGVRWQNDQDEFDPEDINYCTFRWITTPNTFAMSGLRSDPISGEMIDGDVIFDASWIRAWKEEYAMLIGKPAAANAEASLVAPEVLAMGEIISPIMAVKYGYGLPGSTTRMLRASGRLSEEGQGTVIPAGMSPIQRQLAERLHAGRYACCQCASAKRHEYALAAVALARSNAEKKGDKDSKEMELPDEFIGQAIKEVVMHEVGHSLGLRHNFKASTMLSLDEINDPKVTRERGMVGSVMDYAPLNIVAGGKGQGDFATTTIGPYDYWAIEYAYRPFSSNEKEELEKIASRSPEPDLVFATDEDMYMANDPLVNVYDLGDDPLRYAQQRVQLAQELLKDLDERAVADGESWARLRPAFSVLLGQYGNAAYLASSYIAGEHVARDHKGGDKARDPITPVDFARQREALKFVTDNIFSDKMFQFDAKVLRRLAVENWYHWGSYDSPQGSSGVNLYDRVLGIQRIALGHCLSSDVLRRLQNQQLMASEKDDVLKMDEVFRALTDSIWTELASDSKEPCCSTLRRNLQREHLSQLARIVVGPNTDLSNLFFVSFSPSNGSYPADARSLAKMHLREIESRVASVLKNNEELDDATRAHLEECKDQIAKVLNAQVETKP